jgi:hypothetical protein
LVLMPGAIECFCLGVGRLENRQMSDR